MFVVHGAMIFDFPFTRYTQVWWHLFAFFGPGNANNAVVVVVVGFLCYRIFKVLKLFRFSTDHN